jgi:hypothetical protein
LKAEGFNSGLEMMMMLLLDVIEFNSLAGIYPNTLLLLLHLLLYHYDDDHHISVNEVNI